MQPSRTIYGKLRGHQRNKSSNEDLSKDNRQRNTPTPRLDNTQQVPPSNLYKPSPNNQSAKAGDFQVNSSYIKANVTSNNLEYINQLIKQKAARESNKQKTVKKEQGHYRNKSSIVQSNNKNFYQNFLSGNSNDTKKTNEDRGLMTPDTINQTQSTKKDTPNINVHDFGDHKVEIDANNMRLSSPHDIQQNMHNNTPTIKEEKLFENFFQGNGMKKSVSLEDLQIDKKDFGTINSGSTKAQQQSQTRGYNSGGPTSGGTEFVYNEQAEAQDKKPQEALQTPGNFLTSIDQYIRYFDENSASNPQTLKSTRFQLDESGKQSKGPSAKKDTQGVFQENQFLKAQVDKLKMVVNELINANKNVSNELHHARSRQEEYKYKLQKAEDHILSLKHKNKYYKEKISHTQDLLEQERIENESNLVALKKILANNISYALEQHHHHQKPYEEVVSPQNQSRKEKHHHKDNKATNLKNFLSEAFLSKDDYNRGNKSRDKRYEKNYASHRYDFGPSARSKDPESRYISHAYYQESDPESGSTGEEYKNNGSDDSYDSADYEESSDPEYAPRNRYEPAPHFQQQPTHRKQQQVPAKQVKAGNLHERIAEVMDDDSYQGGQPYSSKHSQRTKSQNQSRRNTPDIINVQGQQQDFRSRQPSWSHAQQHNNYMKQDNSQMRYQKDFDDYNSGNSFRETDS